MANFVDDQYGILTARSTRVLTFFSDLESRLSSISAPNTAHLELYWDGSKVSRISDNTQIASLSAADQLKYYNHGLGLMKLAINAKLYS
jgi:hypothetical protein